MAKIAIDVDNTLYSFDNECREAFFEMAIEKDDKTYLKGAYAPQVEWRSLADVLGWEALSEAIEKVHDRTAKQMPYKGAVEVVNKLSNNDHEIKYVTTRNDKYHEDTDWWLAKHEFPISKESDLICSDGDKLQHISDCQYLIDDRPKTILDFIYDYEWRKTHVNGWIPNKPRKAFGLWFAYNQALTDVDNVYLAPTWTGIEYYLKKKGLL